MYSLIFIVILDRVMVFISTTWSSSLFSIVDNATLLPHSFLITATEISKENWFETDLNDLRIILEWFANVSGEYN